MHVAYGGLFKPLCKHVCWFLIAIETQAKILPDDIFGFLLYLLFIIIIGVDACPGEAARDPFKA